MRELRLMHSGKSSNRGKGLRLPTLEEWKTALFALLASIPRRRLELGSNGGGSPDLPYNGKAVYPPYHTHSEK